jgi:hypothetical protein
MDYAADVFTDGDDSDFGPQYIYDDPRYFSKIYVLLKSIGFVFYTTTLTMCSTPELYIAMIGVMGVSALNSARYEYNHYQRYGTTFPSLDEYHRWKKDQWPKSRAAFAIIELGIKIVVFIMSFPPQFDFRTICQAAQSILHIHILVLFMIYAITGICTVCVLSSIYCCNEFIHEPDRRISRVIQRPIATLPLLTVLNHYQNEECCICLDIDNIQIWVLLPCGHKFHNSCISRWLVAHHTCPVCRLSMR